MVFVVPESLGAETRASLQDALATQLELVNTQLVLLTLPPAAETPAIEQRVLSGKELAHEHAALGVLWLDPRPTDHWFIYAMDAAGERIVVRPLLVRQESMAAAAEAVAMIARGAAEALLHGEPVAGEPAEIHIVEAPLPPPPPAPTPEPGMLRLAAGYCGNTFAAKVPWQSGVSVSAGWFASTGPFLIAGYAILAEDRVGSDVVLALTRHPITLGGGYRFHFRSLSLDSQLSVTADFLNRRTLTTPTERGIDPARTRAVIALSPAIRAELAVTPWLGLFVSLGCDVLLNNFEYVSQATDPAQTVLSPHALRLLTQAGVAILR